MVNTISSEITIPGLQAANLIEILYGVRNAIPDEERVAKFMIQYVINYLGMIAMAAGDVSADIPTTPEELVEAWRAA